jgi:predicted DNA-binding transcriptional regulator AlpA
MPSNTPTLETIVPELLTTAQAAQLCGIGERSLYRHSRSGAAPAPVKIGGSGTVRYRRSELLAWIAAGCPRCNGKPEPTHIETPAAGIERPGERRGIDSRGGP